MRKAVITSLIFFIIGTLVGKQFFASKVTIKEIIEQPKVITKKLMEIKECRPKDCDNKLVKSYYQKAILLFLASVSQK